MKQLRLSQWMAEIDDTKEVLTLNMAGAHDCAAQFVQAPHFARCQELSVYDLLCRGVRGLDIRVEPDGDRLVLVHGSARIYRHPMRVGGQADLSYLLSMCYRFLEQYPSECILFQFKNDSRRAMEACFDNLFDTYIRKHRAMWFCDNRSPRLGEVRGKILLQRRCDMAQREAYTPHSTGMDFSQWIEQDEAVNEPLTMETGFGTFLIQDRYAYKPQPRWDEVVKPFLDARKPFDGTYVINYLSTAGGARGPYLNARYLLPRFHRYRLIPGVYYGMTYLDFPTKESVRHIIMSNEELTHEDF